MAEEDHLIKKLAEPSLSICVEGLWACKQKTCVSGCAGVVGGEGGGVCVLSTG